MLDKKLNDYFDRFLNAKEKVSQRSHKTLAWYGRQIRPWIAWLSTNATADDWLEPDTLEEYLGECAATLNEKSLFARYVAIRVFLRWLKRRRLITGDLPTELIEIPSVGVRKPRVAETAVVDAAIRTAWQNADNWLDYRDVLLIQALRSCGLRIGELTTLRIYHVDLRDGFILVEQGKGNKDRIVPFDEAFRKAFTAYQFNRPAYDADWLFLGANGHRQPTGAMSVTSIRSAIRRRCAAAGVDYFNPHSVRHAFAIDRLNNGMQLSAVSAVMGHTSVSFTAKVYARWVKAGLRREYDNAGR